MPAGRPPLPTSLKLLRGNPGKRRLNAAEPRPEVPAKPLRLPRHLRELLSDDVARAEWRRVAALLQKTRVLAAEDMVCLAIYCLNVSRLAKAEVEIKRDGPVAVGAQGGAYISAWTNL